MSDVASVERCQRQNQTAIILQIYEHIDGSPRSLSDAESSPRVASPSPSMHDKSEEQLVAGITCQPMAGDGGIHGA